MADFIGPIVDVGIRLWNFGRIQTGYILHLQENLESLRIAMDALRNVRDGVQSRVDMDEAQGMVRTAEVRGWLDRVEAIEVEVNLALQQGSQQRCMSGCRSPWNCCSSYKLGKKAVVQMFPTVNELQSIRFDLVADRLNPALVLQKMLDISTIGMDPFLKKAMELLELDEVNILGIYGMGGVGKTTLLTKIYNEFVLKLNANRDVEEMVIMIWVVASKELDLGKIQYEVAKRLGLPVLQNDGDLHLVQRERGNAISNILSSKKFMLFLDDCWQRVDLESIGIPLPNYRAGSSSNNKKSKVVFTTRSEMVCASMEASKKMRVECLDQCKAWKLFQEKVGREADNSDPEICEVAKLVAKECGGLPLALITIGIAMQSNDTLEAWKYALTELRKSKSKFSGEVFPLLKFSYDRLHADTIDDDKIKSCFLYCCLFPEDANIEKEELIKHWIAEGFLDGFDSMDEAYNKGHYIISRLKAVCLLESGLDDSETQVKMHDMIRDLAIWIGCECETKKDKYLVQVRANYPSEAWNETERVSLAHKGITSLGDYVSNTCSNLLTLMLQSNWSLRHIHYNFFQFVSTLKVLNLSRTGISWLPKTISNLVELQLLDLSHCTEIERLPDDLKKLVKLIYLDLSHTSSLTIIPEGVISDLSNLQMLNLYASGFGYWKDENSDLADIIRLVGGGVHLMEVQGLKHLSSLGLAIYSTTLLLKFFNNDDYKKLRVCTQHLAIERLPGPLSFNILPSSSSLAMASSLPSSSSPSTSSLSTPSLFFGDMQSLKTLSLNECALENLTINWVGVEKDVSCLFPSLETLILSNLSKLNIKWAKCSRQQCFQKLRTLQIGGCYKLKDLTWLLYVPNLLRLHVSDCKELKTILSEVEEREIRMMKPFSRLKELELERLPTLESICEHTFPFFSLEAISVYDCPVLAKLPFDSNGDHNKLQMILGSVEWWDKLQWKDEIVKSAFRPYFEQHLRK